MQPFKKKIKHILPADIGLRVLSILILILLLTAPGSIHHFLYQLTGLNIGFMTMAPKEAFADENQPPAQPVDEAKKITEQTDLIEKTLEIESKEINDLAAYLSDLQNGKADFDSTINVYKIELTTFGSQLHLSEIETKTIEKAYMSSQTSVGKVTQELTKLQDRLTQLEQQQQAAYDQKMGNDKFLIELRQSMLKKNNVENERDKTARSVSRDPAQILQNGNEAQQPGTAVSPQTRTDAKTEQMQLYIKQQLEMGRNGDPIQRAALDQRLSDEIRQAEEERVKQEALAEEERKKAEDKSLALARLQIRMQLLQTVLTKKLLLIQSIHSIIDNRVPQLEEIQAKYKALISDLEVNIRDSKKAELLTRKTNPLTQGTWSRMGEDFSELFSMVTALFSKDNWINSFSFIWQPGIHRLLSFFAVLIMLLFISVKSKLFIKRVALASPHLEERHWSRRALKIAGNNIVISAVTSFLYLCVKFKLFFSYSIIANMIVSILIFLVFILWTIDFCREMKQKFDSVRLDEVILFLKALNLVAVIYILFGSALKSDSSIVTAYRFICELILYFWALSFFKKVLPEMEDYIERQKKTKLIKPVLCKNCAMSLLIAGIILELLGYGTLASYWYTSWGKTIVVLAWSGLMIGASREWIPGGVHPSGQSESSHPQGHAQTTFSVAWLVKQLTFITLFFIITISLMLSWASSDYVFPWLYKAITYKFVVGSMSFSLSSIAQAIMLIIITHFIAKSWRHLFQKNFLSESGLDQGLQESMTTITVYSIWIFGIFIALITFGLNTTTLTVAFGALGIGIGFGLQNIFSNFISGIILLFERPIQVGDDIEVNGTWAKVKKTNVRSTVVQTYDNSTIIIPNSELISNRVTNWSFKDKRLRRKVTIGVEYGSDTELVKECLLEIAQKNPRILSYPEPDVIFEDFGASALIFTLRFWTFIDYFMAIETDIRFTIDKLFKEKGIAIAFPQQDINIRSFPPGFLEEAISKAKEKEKANPVSD